MMMTMGTVTAKIALTYIVFNQHESIVAWWRHGIYPGNLLEDRHSPWAPEDSIEPSIIRRFLLHPHACN